MAKLYGTVLYYIKQEAGSAAVRIVYSWIMDYCLIWYAIMQNTAKLTSE